MSEAKKLKLGQKVSLFQAYTSTKKESKTYYKVEVQKKKKLYVTYQIYSDHASKFEYTLYQKDKKTGKFISFDFVRPDLFEESGRKITKCLSEDTDVDMKTWKVTKKKAAVPAGTYYIKVKRGNGMCSFTIK